MVVNESCGTHIDQAISSAVNQNYPPSSFEIIIFFDGTDNHYWNFLCEITSNIESPTIRLIRGVGDEGIGAARNNAIEAASNEFLMLLDGDDYLFPDALLSCSHVIRPGIDLVFSDWTKVDVFGNVRYLNNSGRIYFQLHKRFKGSIYDPLFYFIFILQCQFIRRSAFFKAGCYNPLMTVGESSDFLIRLSQISKGINFDYVPDALYAYRDNPRGVCNTKKELLMKNRLSNMSSHVKTHCQEIMSMRYFGRVQPGNVRLFIPEFNRKCSFFELPYVDYINKKIIDGTTAYKQTGELAHQI
ncbi:MAG: glycosyltransferase [Actinomycetota bacterium]|jgi:cellulose synthase/poly-beta-1,6-N-acetylglucosamine synthase-like glycosyltransferase|nr:glycosyltransferase [Actinomycetota bacterium]MCL6094060.1 glycosyltransferase [Actinomycetota bacterium]MDA8167858.1 glycosyltransferase [Actinomycetota bacterium]